MEQKMKLNTLSVSKKLIQSMFHIVKGLLHLKFSKSYQQLFE